MLISRGVEMDGKVLVDDQDNVKSDELPLSNNVPENGLAVKTQIYVEIIHDNMQWNAMILLNSKYTIGMVRSQLLLQEGGECFENVPLTWKGRVVGDEVRTDTLEDIAKLSTASELTEFELAQLRLIGRKWVSIMDIDLGEMSTVTLHDVTDTMTIQDVLKLYQTKERRGYLHIPILTIYVEGETNKDNITTMQGLSLGDTVYSAGIESSSTLALKTGMFEVLVKEQNEIDAAAARQKGIGSSAKKHPADDVAGIRVLVFDWWKVRQLKDAYSTLVTDGLTQNDHVYLDTRHSQFPTFNDELSDEKPLYYYHIYPEDGIHTIHDSTFIIKREDFTQTFCMYICADCGEDVKLKPKDHPRCRACGHRIVFKKRIAKPCQYLCR